MSFVLFLSFFFLSLGIVENSYGSTFLVAKNCRAIIKNIYFVLVQRFDVLDSMILIEEKINSFIVKFIGKLFKCLLYIVNVLRRSIWFIWKGN